ncbi:hypothetical protein HII36_49545 [Nonomuraea sp. NN258]|uniref:hypothetical protein n=1 Tax=Nonomuraea antri TaxID=2730852 RepID=UPI001568585B|nr:hypothetical protein [Nonomuraea antri]NRQ39823.1 hypothetical protein [Nonomuraea antri]
MPIALLAALLSGCGTRSCTQMAAPPGIGLTVEAPLADRARDAALEVCWDGFCRRPRVALSQATRPGAQTCSDGACAVTAVPAPQRVGFGDVSGLPKRPVRVRLTLLDAAGATLLDRTIQVTPRPLYPNGRDCGEDGPATSITVQADGTLSER